MIHPAAAVGFSRSADAYERARPGYPADAVEYVVSQLPAGARVLDLAAGTGKLTRPLMAAGLDVVAVEPVAEMRAALPDSVESHDGTAQAIPVAGGSVDAVTVAQAFHWFAEAAALREIHRVLRPRGLLALVWNRRTEDDPVNRRIDELLAPYRDAAPTHRFNAWRSAFEAAHGVVRPAGGAGVRQRAGARRRRLRGAPRLDQLHRRARRGRALAGARAGARARRGRDGGGLVSLRGADVPGALTVTKVTDARGRRS